MAEISYSTFVLSLGSDTQFLHNISTFLYTASCGRGGFVVRFRRFPCSCSFRQKVSTNFGPRARGRLGGLGDFPPLAKRRELERVGLNEFTLLRQFVLRGGLASFLLDFWQLSQGMAVISFERRKTPR